MQKQQLIGIMIDLLQDVIDEQSEGNSAKASASLPIVGPDATITSMGLVSFISDVEVSLEENYDIELILVSEKALSRKKSPFRTIDALADYVLELTVASTEKEEVAAD